MARDNVAEIKVSLGRIEELFAEPEADPFDPDSRYRTGMQELLDQVHGARGKALQVVVELPQEALEPGTQQKAESAFRRYCQAMIDELQRQLKDHWHLMRRQLVTALALLTILVVAAGLIMSAEYLRPLVQGVAVFALGVFGYSTLWAPADLVLYAWRPLQQDLGWHRQLLDAELVVRAQG